MTILFQEDFEGDGWYKVPVGSGIMKDGWVPWFSEQKVKVDENGDHYGWENLIPEPGHPDANDPHLDVLVHSGVKCLQVSLRFATHWAGAYRVHTAPGLTGAYLTFSCYGHTRYHGSGSENPDHPGEIGMKVGIDPTGGIDALADTVVWGPEHPEAVTKGFDETVWVLFTVTAVAQSDSITVFLHSNPEWAVEFVGPNWDDAMLTMTEGLLEECWGQPRIQYSRVYNVISSVEEAHQVLDLVGLQTIGPSSDDAGMGMLDDKTAVEWNRAEDVQEDYRELYTTYYPRAKVQFKHTNAGPITPGITLYSQRDPRWRDYQYGSGGMTLGAAGCYITAIAMVASRYGYDDTPQQVADKLYDSGALVGTLLSRPELIPDAYPNMVYGGTVHWRSTAADLGKLAEWLEEGPVIIETEFVPGGVQPPTDQHFVVALELDGDDLIIADPWTGEITRLLERYALASWDLQCTIYGARLVGITDDDTPDATEPLYDNLLGLHIQRPVDGITEYYASAHPSVFKTVLNFQTVVGIKLVSPQTLTIIRPYPNDVRGVGVVRDIVAGIADDLYALHQHIDYVELINEQVASNDPVGTRLAVETEIAGMEALKALGVPVKPLILNVAVGNPYGPWDPVNEQLLLLPAIEAAESLFGPGGYAVGYHGYWPSNLADTYLTYTNINGVRKYVGRYFSFRWMEWDKDVVAHGYRPHYINTEMGPMGTHGPRPEDGYIDMLGYDGWRSGRCLGGNRPRLINELARWQAELAAWNVTHGNRALGGTIFTTGGGSKWATFAFERHEMEAWATGLGL